jgi:23S rRNA (uracil1939-C5)-methyltransferase
MTHQTLTIRAVGHRGDGIAETDQGIAFIPFTLPGETVTATPVPGHPDRLDLEAVLTPSPDRITPVCAHFGTCGGCVIQHWREDRYRHWKRSLVMAALAEAGIAADVADLVDAHGEGRRRATLHARWGTRDVLEVGFAAQRSHRIIGIDHCPVLSPGMAGAIPAAWAIADVLKPTRKPVDIAITDTQTGLDVDVRGTGPLDARLTGALADVARAHRLARLTRHGEMVVQIALPTVRIGPADVALPPGSFLQATAAGEAVLGGLVQSAVGKAKRVADLFCGVGPFALRLAASARVAAFDSDAPAVAALAKAAPLAAGLKPVEAVARDLFRRPLLAPELASFDAVVLDPPRQGAEAQARILATTKVRRIVMVSCNPTTFARDARILIEGGYQIGTVTPVDQFRHSAHVELVAAFARA